LIAKPPDEIARAIHFPIFEGRDFFVYLWYCIKHKKMKTIINSTTVALLVLVGIAQLNTSCTLVGFAVGYNIDAKNYNENKTEDIKPAEIDRLKTGRNLVIVNTAGDSVSGKYEGTSQMEHEKYLENYNHFKALHSDDLSIPMIGDTIDVYGIEFNTTEKKRFVGVEINTIVLSSLDKNKTITVPISYGNVIVYYNNLPFMANRYSDLPLLTTVLLKDTSNNMLTIPVNEIGIIKADKISNARFKGLLIGMGIDAAVLVVSILAYGIATDWNGIY
jgi:hypothetical protein